MIAGVTLWGLLVPEAIAYSGLANLPPQVGLYTLLTSLAAFAIFGSSKHLVCAGTTAAQVMLASVVMSLNPSSPSAYYSLATALVLLVGAVFLVCSLFRLGFITQFISEPVMLGFIAGTAIYVTVKQLPKLFGVPRGTGETIQLILQLVGNLGQTNYATLAIGVAGLVVLISLERLAPRIPSGLVVFVFGIFVGTVLDLPSFGVQIVGRIPQGIPSPTIPEVSVDDLLNLLPGAAGIMLLVFSEAIGASSAFAEKHGYETRPNQDLFAFSIANFGSGILGGYVAGGSTSSTAVNEKAGAQTQLSTILAAGLALFTVAALTSLFHNLPEAILAALIINAVRGLIRVRDLRAFYRLQRQEFALGMIALVGVVTLGLLRGLLIAIILSLVLVIARSSRPHVSVLGEVPRSKGAYRDATRYPEARQVSGLLILSLTSPLVYYNCKYVRESFKELIRRSHPPPKAILINMHANESLDITAAQMLGKFLDELHEQGTEVMFADLHKPVIDFARQSGLLDKIGERDIFLNVQAGVDAFNIRHPKKA
jgi:high affinity sulfate transporter 1